jgi:transposase
VFAVKARAEESGSRDLLIRQRTQSINAFRAHLAELGIVAAQGDSGVTELLAIVADEQDTRLPIDARASVIVLAAQLEAMRTLIGSIEKRIKTQHRSNEVSQRVETIPGIGVLGATAIVATAADPTIFRSGRDFAAWIGLVPRQDSTGGKQKLGPISKQGDHYLRRILIVGAIAVLRRAQENPGKYPWLTQLLARRPFKVVAVALANKMARTAWALMVHGGTGQAVPAAVRDGERQPEPCRGGAGRHRPQGDWPSRSHRRGLEESMHRPAPGSGTASPRCHRRVAASIPSRSFCRRTC